MDTEDDEVCVRPEDCCSPQKLSDIGVEGCSANDDCSVPEQANDCRGDLVCGSNTCTSAVVYKLTLRVRM